MLKYYSIINQLSEKDKIRLLTDVNCLSSKEFKILGIPEIKIAEANNYCPDLYPSAISLSNSWDMKLIGEVAENIYKAMSDDNIGLISVPSPKIKINPYRPALSEDPFLSSSVTREYLKAAEKTSAVAAIDVPSFGHSDIEWLDEVPDSRFVHEYVFKAYCDSADNLSCSALITESDSNLNGYNEINSLLTSKAYTEAVSKTAITVCRKVSTDNTVSHIANGGLCFEGSAPALESALLRYKQTRNAIEHGHSTIEDLNTELALGKAISPETIDEATDRLIDFAFSVKRKPQLGETTGNRSLSLSACEESTVLLKNKSSVLPLKKSTKVCIIGDIAVSTRNGILLDELKNALTAYGYQFVGSSRGYDIKTDRSEDMISEAYDLVSISDVALIFLGLGANRESGSANSRKISIPANQQHLLDSLSESKDKIVAILQPDYSPDIVLTDNCAGILLAPLETESSAQALANIISGKVSPSGKLSSTVYTNTDKLHTEYKTRRIRDGIKSGPFIGYRYYDTSGEPQEFPFGHGLSYTEFSYSRLTVREGKVKFFVKNEGKIAASEIAQLYIGMENPAIIMPRKELRGFQRIDLKPGEKKAIEIPLNLLQVYDDKSSSFTEPAGVYKIYIGSSSDNIKLTEKIRAGNTTIESDGRKSVDYIHTQSNIKTDNFKLEEKAKTMKKSVFNFITGAISLILAIVLKLYCISSGNDSLFFDCFAIALGFLGLILFISEAVRRNKIHKTQRKEIDTATAKSFEQAEKITEYDAAAMFAKEFDSENDESNNLSLAAESDVSAEYIAYIDKSQSFASAAAEFETFAASRGLKIHPTVVKKVFSALASSRLIVTYGMNDKDFKSFMTVLSNYFESQVFIDRVDSSYTSTESLLFKTDLSGSKLKTQTLFAIEAARTTSYNIHFAGLTNVSSSELPSYFSAYINYVKNPYGRHHVMITNDRNVEVSYYIPQNLWFVLNISESETPDKLPDFIIETATVNAFPFSECDPSGQYPNIKKFSYHQLELLTERVGSKFFIKEENWKKVDKLEYHLSRCSDYEIGNRIWLCLEKFASVFLAAEGGEDEALDEAVSAKLMASIIATYKAYADKFDQPLNETIESIFGEGNIDTCMKMIKYCDRT